tara:strand:+ start:433 stop:621 length:189 start_codon:yes stop_codon:yes gene_type:complete
MVKNIGQKVPNVVVIQSIVNVFSISTTRNEFLLVQDLEALGDCWHTPTQLVGEFPDTSFRVA